MRHGHTLLELLAVLMILAILATIATPPLGRWRDAAAVAAARDEVAARLAWTRVAAAAHGGASLVLEVGTGRYRVELADGLVTHDGDLRDRHGVTLETGGSTQSLDLRYDALGIGRMTGGTLRFRRGYAVAGLTVSLYGRFRRW